MHAGRYRIAKSFEFAASHQLEGLAPDHKCARLHGHNYKVQLILESRVLSSEGFVEDYGDLADFRKYLDCRLDHRHLNDVLPEVGNPTAENLARHLWCVARHQHPDVIAVRVSETPNTWAEFEA